MKYRAIVFDVGDTLAESFPSQRQIYRERLSYVGVSTDDQLVDDVVKAVSEAANGQIAKEKNGASRMPDADFAAMLDAAALRLVNADVPENLERLSRLPMPEPQLRPVDGAAQVLKTLRDKGYRLAVVSNHRASLPARLEAMGLADFFETMVVSEIVGVEKPDPQIMRIALERLSLPPEACLYVGDHPFDVSCAKDAGLDCAWIAAPESVLPESVPYVEDYRIAKLTELLNHL